MPPRTAATSRATPRGGGHRTRLTRRRLLAVAGALPAAACATRLAAPALDLPVPSGAPALRGPVVDVRAFGARGDGVADDSAAALRALDATRGTRGTVLFPAGTYRLPLGTPLVPGPGVTLAGDPGRSVLRLEPTGVLAAIDVDAPDVVVDGLVLERAADVPTVLVRVGRADRLTLARLVLLGHTERWPSFCHGVQLGIAGGTSTALSVRDSVVSGCEYGLFQANESVAVTVGVAVTGCTFARNTNTDLEFNSPAGSFRGVRVSGCTFRDNDSPGFAVGLAHCADVAVTGCAMTGYRMEAVHIEDWTAGVRVENNVFTACGLREFAHVQIISGSSDVAVRGNVHDASMNTAAVPVVGALPGGSGLTAGGRPVLAPTGISVTGNRMSCSPAVRAVSFDGVVGGTVASNRVDGPGVAAAPTGALFRVVGGSGVRVTGNVVAGAPR